MVSEPFRQIFLWHKNSSPEQGKLLNPQREFLCSGRKSKGLTVTSRLVAAMAQIE